MVIEKVEIMESGLGANYTGLNFGEGIQSIKSNLLATKRALSVRTLFNSTQCIGNLEFLPLLPSSQFKNHLLVLHCLHS